LNKMSGSKEAEDRKNELIAKAVGKLDTSDMIHHKISGEESLKKLKVTVDAGLTTAQVEKL